MGKKICLAMIVVVLACSCVKTVEAGEAAQAEALAAALQAYAVKTGTEIKTFEPRRTAFVDLNGDRRPDALVLLEGREWCGTGGCTLLVLKGGKDGFTFVSRSSLIRGPLLVSDKKSHGWRHLVVDVSGGGLPPKKVALKFNGRKYPLNPSVQPALPPNAALTGETVLQP